MPGAGEMSKGRRTAVRSLAPWLLGLALIGIGLPHLALPAAASDRRADDLALHAALTAAVERAVAAADDSSDPLAPTGISSGCLASPLPTTPTGTTLSFSARETSTMGFDAVIWRQPCVNDASKSAVLMRAVPFGSMGSWICSSSWYVVQGGITTSSPKWVSSNGGSGLCGAYYSTITVALDQWSFYTQFNDQTAFSLRTTYPTLSPSSIEVPASGPGTRHLLTVQVTGTGSGTVSSSPSGVSCRTGSCSAEYGQGTTVTLTATPDGTHAFSRWGGDCSGTSRTTTVTISAARTCTARFTPPPVHPETGWWWAASEPGRGYSIETSNGRLFMASYAYRTDGSSAWYLSQGDWDGTTLTTSFDEYRGGQSVGGSWRQASPVGAMGSFTIAFSTATRGTITWSNGQSTTIERFNFAGDPAAARTMMTTMMSAATPPRPQPAKPVVGNDDEGERIRALREKTAKLGEGRVIVTLSASRAAIAADGVLAQGMLAPHGGRVAATFSRLPMFVAEVTPAGLDALLADPAVASVHEDEMLRTMLLASTAKVRAPEVWSRGYSGQGQSVAVLDTGVDATHPFLGGRVIAEACFSTSVAASGIEGVCPNGANSMIGPGAGAPCAIGCEHGTHVAGIVAGNGNGMAGVAPSAGIVAVQVFKRYPPSLCGSSSGCISASSSDIILGLAHVRDNAVRYGIAAANLSLGGSLFSSYCDSQPYKPVIDQLRAIGVATVIATGNEYQTNRVSSPGCISTAVRVGAVSSEDALAPFANEWSLPMLLAPGNTVNSSIPSGGFAAWAGTSMATPHVAGAWAVLKSALPGSSVSALLSAITSTGASVRSPWSLRSYPRLDVAAAHDRLTLPDTGWWWNTSEPGTGYFVEVQRGSAFLSAYMYDDAGKATWYIANGTFAGGVFTGSLQEFWGGQSMGGSWRQADFAADRGQVTLRSSGTGTGSLTLPSGRQMALTRFGF